MSNEATNQENFTLDKSNLISALRMGVNYTHNATVRGLSVPLRPLSIQETIEVTNTVMAEVQSMNEIERTRISEHSLIAIHTLVRASKPSPEAGIHESKLSAMILRQMTNDELHTIYNEYAAVCDKTNPSLETMGEEKLIEMVEEVKKNHSVLTDFSFVQLVNMVKYLLTKETSQQDK